MENRTLVKKLAEVVQQVKFIPKNGHNTFNNYKYATEADVNEKVREELASRHVMMIPNVKSHSIREHTNRKGNIEYITTVEVEFTFMDGESGETITFTTFGEGQDAGDKGTYKAITGAQKYALMKAFMIPTGDDPEADNGVDERNQGEQQPRRNTPDRKLSEAQIKRLFAIASSKGINAGDVKKGIIRDYKKTNAEDLTKKEYDELCNRLQSVKTEKNDPAYEPSDVEFDEMRKGS